MNDGRMGIAQSLAGGDQGAASDAGPESETPGQEEAEQKALVEILVTVKDIQKMLAELMGGGQPPAPQGPPAGGPPPMMPPGQ